MKGFTLRSELFRRERERSWKQLEGVLDQAGRRGAVTLPGEELMRLPALHRGAASSLAVARAISLDRALLDYLEALAQRSYFAVYGVRRPLGSAIAEFVTRRFPEAVRRARWAVLVSAIAVLLGSLVGFSLTWTQPERYYAFVDEGLAGGRDPAASTEFLRQGLYDDGGSETGELGAFASFLFAHNARVGMLCFALGFVVGVPTIALLFATGLMLGAFFALYGSRGLGVDLAGWIFPHGVTEILALVLCGAAGLSIGRAVAFPGRLGRWRSLTERGRAAGVLVVGATGMFLIAGLLEGIFRQVVTDVGLRFAVVALTTVGWTAYFTTVGRRRGP